MKTRLIAVALPFAVTAMLSPATHADKNLFGYVKGSETSPAGASESHFGPEVHPLEAWWLRLHGLMAMAALALGGSLAPNHMRPAWNRRKNMRSGVPMLALTVWLAASGYALYYFSTDDNAAWLPLLHWIAGLALPVILVVHIRIGRRRAPRAVKRAHQPPQLHVVAQPHARKQARS